MVKLESASTFLLMMIMDSSTDISREAVEGHSEGTDEFCWDFWQMKSAKTRVACSK